MRRVLERTTIPKREAVVTAEESEFRLPFFAEETSLGTLHRRVLRLSAAHRTGRASTQSAKDADCTLLSLLALDPALAQLDVSRALYLDTETTGLSGGTGTVAFLLGLATFDEAGLFVEQLLVRNLGEEAPMLAHAGARIDACSMLVTFNGKSFDMPLLRTRFAMARMPPPKTRPHLDLLHVARRIHRKKSKLTMLEDRVLGFVREGDVPSGEVSARYLDFLRSGNENALLGVVEHNAQDVISMTALVGLYGEPLASTALTPADLVGVARTLHRAGATDDAFEAATMASTRGAGRDALRARAAISRARGDRDRALADLEAVLAEENADAFHDETRFVELDADRSRRRVVSTHTEFSSVRLELAKLYEHHKKDAARALELVARGVAEDAPRSERRRERLERKLAIPTAPKIVAASALREALSPFSHAPRVLQAVVLTVKSMSDEAERERYSPAAIEPKWQRHWDEHKTFVAERHAGRPKKYILDMFPYPSGDGLHVGHPEGYTATDIVSRYFRMRGFDVLHPMGWDAFGLPAEQHAIKTGRTPRATTLKNIQTFRRQLKMLGFSYDWSREIDTTDPKYVRWTQWIFLQLYKKGLAFQQSDMPVNWCPELGTVLANDEVTSEGKSEVGGFPVEKLKIRQWSLKITAYADRLLAGLKTLDWPETKAKQTDWIGRSEGATVKFDVRGSTEKIEVFTTRVDTLPGATYVVLAPEHKLVSALTSDAHRAEVDAYVAQASKKNDRDRSDVTREKTGVPLGAIAINPINGDEIPIWIGDYVIGTYGTGAVMAVPAHDERDHAFAKKYSLPIVQVVAPAKNGQGIDVQKEAFTDDGVAFHCRVLDTIAIAEGLPSAEVRTLVTAHLAKHAQGAARVTYKLRDWVFARQRYWGEPVPIYFPVELPNGGDPRKGAEYKIRYDKPIPLEDSELPLLLPDLDDYAPRGDKDGPLARATDWRFFQKVGAGASADWYARETNTMPQWAGSCWYYLRFLDPHNNDALFSKDAYDAWMPVDLYVGGNEHAVLHLLYARFWHEVLFDLGIVKDPEPFMKLVHQGMILGENNEKMSKSRGNVVNPDDVVAKNGADALRVYEMFMGPLESTKPWQTSGIDGVRRFLDRAWLALTGPISETCDDVTKKLLHKTIKKVGEDIESLRFNTAVSAMMIFVNRMRELNQNGQGVPREAADAFALILSPFAPHIGEELWQRLGHEKSLAHEAWPSFDPALVKDDTVEIGVQVNGKVRGTVQLPVDATQDVAVAAAKEDAKINSYLEGKTQKKIIYVPGKILSFIVA